MMEGYKNTLVCMVITVIFVGIRSQHTTTNVCSNKGEIPCDDGQCIENRMWCDKEYNCFDRSDESYCKTKSWPWKPSPNECSDIHFECSNGQCVPAAARCNSYNNCEDDSDEEYCDDETSEPEPLITTTEANPSDDPYNLYNGYASTRSTKRSPTATPERDFWSTTITNFYEDRYRKGFDISNIRNPPPAYYTQGGNNRHTTQPTISSPSYFNVHTSNRPRQTTQNPNIGRYPGGYTLIPPRSVLNLPPPRPAYSDRYRSQNLNLPAFYFAKNYTEEYQYHYEDRLDDAKKWLIGKRDGSYSWGKDTPRGLIALSLTTNSFSSNVSDNYLMKKSLQTHLGIKILRDDTGIETMSTTRLAMYINAVLATCQNPSDFLSLNLVDILYQKGRTMEPHQAFINPLIFLTLCLANKPVHRQDIQYLEHWLTSTFRSEIEKDIHILAMTALSCYSQRDVANNDLRSKLQIAVRDLLTQRNKTNGSFGSVYTTALAAQALMSINTTMRWDPRLTLDYIAEHQADDGSFGDMLLTYYSIIALSGRSLVHLRNTQCDTVTEERKEVSDCPAAEIVSRRGPTKNIYFTLRIGLPQTFSVSQQLTVPVDTDFMEIMCVAKHMDQRYKYKYKVTNGLYSVYSVAGIPNDPERGLFWSLYVLPPGQTQVDVIHHRHTKDMKLVIPKDGDEVLFWYLPSS